MLRLRLCLLALVLALSVLPAAAQTVQEIAIGGAISGQISDAVPAPSFLFSGRAGQTLTARLEVLDTALRPVLLVATEDNRVLTTFSGPPGAQFVGGSFALSQDGRYFAQVQGAGGTRGRFTLALLEGAQPVQPPTATPPPTLTPSAAPPSATPSAATPPASVLVTDLLPGQIEEAGVSADNFEQLYRLRPAAFAQVLDVRVASEGALVITLRDAAGGDPIALFGARTRGGAVILPPFGADTPAEYRLSLRHAGGGFVVRYRIALSALLADAPLLASATVPPVGTPPTATPTPSPSPISPAQVDLLLTWSSTEWMLTNISGRALDLATIAFSGISRRADADTWRRGNPGLNLSAFPPGHCAGFRPLAYPDSPPLPPGCTMVSSWWSDNSVGFWLEGESFTVTLNGTQIAQCALAAGTCGVDVP